MFSQVYNEAVAILLIRTVTGILFFFQGYDRLFKVKTENVVRAFSVSEGKIHFPKFLMSPAVALSSFLEMLCGLLLFLGYYKNLMLYILAIDMIFVAFVFSSIKAMWDMNHYFPRLILLIILLFASQTTDYFSIDNFISTYFK